MTVEVAVRAYLLTVSAVTAIVGAGANARIYQLILPMKPTLPALRLQLIDEPIGYHQRGPDGATRSRLQVDAYGSAAVADPYSAAVVTLSDAVDAALSGQVFTSEGLRITGCLRNSRRVGYESEELRIVRCMQDYTIWARVV